MKTMNSKIVHSSSPQAQTNHPRRTSRFLRLCGCFGVSSTSVPQSESHSNPVPRSSLNSQNGGCLPHKNQSTSTSEIPISFTDKKVASVLSNETQTVLPFTNTVGTGENSYMASLENDGSSSKIFLSSLQSEQYQPNIISKSNISLLHQSHLYSDSLSSLGQRLSTNHPQLATPSSLVNYYPSLKSNSLNASKILDCLQTATPSQEDHLTVGQLGDQRRRYSDHAAYALPWRANSQAPRIRIAKLSSKTDESGTSQECSIQKGSRFQSVDKCVAGLSEEQHSHLRRGSFLYRSGELEQDVSHRTSRASSITDIQVTGQDGGGVIVTPFAQILAGMRKVRQNIITLSQSNQSSVNRVRTDSEQGGSSGLRATVGIETLPVCGVGGQRLQTLHQSSHCSFNEQNEDESYIKKMSDDTLMELDWCLKQLEILQTKRSVGDMASSKFKELLNRELKQFVEYNKSDTQISEYIRSYFEVDLDALFNIGNARMPARLSVTICPDLTDFTGQDSMITLKKDSSEEDSMQGSKLSADSFSKGEDDSSRQDKAFSPLSKLNDTFNTEVSKPQRDPLFDTAEPSCVTLPQVNVNFQKSHLYPINNAAVAPLGVHTPHQEELKTILETTLDNWGMDIFKVADLSHNRPLTSITYRIFQRRNLMRIFGIPSHVLVNYLMHVEDHYLSDIPYHNATHAADVTQSIHVLLSPPALEDVFTDLEVLAVTVACAIHDVHHPGVTNQYLINTGHELTIMYNDSSVLENHHLSVAFKLLQGKKCDIFRNLQAKQRQSVRKMMIDLVLATDMSKHMGLLADLKTLVETKRVAGSSILNLDNYSDRIQILQNMIHCADLSNPTKPLAIYRRWTDNIMEEFFRQGDKERQMGLDISPMCDRRSASVAKSQVSFIDFIVHPLWETWAELVHPMAQGILDSLECNRQWFQSQVSLSQSSSLGGDSSKPLSFHHGNEERECAATEGHTNVNSNSRTPIPSTSSSLTEDRRVNDPHQHHHS